MKTKMTTLAQAVSISLLLGANACATELVDEPYDDELEEVGEAEAALTPVGWLCSWKCITTTGVKYDNSGCVDGLHESEADAKVALYGDSSVCNSATSISCSVNSTCTSAAGTGGGTATS